MTNQEVKKQIEYYLSDENLERDEFFHGEISKTEDGYLDLDLFLKCNKIKKMGLKLEQIVESLSESTQLELNESKDKVRRLNNKALPGLIQKKVKKNEKSQKEEQKKEQEDNMNLFENFEPLYFKLSVDSDTKIRYAQVQEKLKSQYNIVPVYCRFATNEGHFVLNKNKFTQEKIDEVIKGGLKVENMDMEVKVCEGMDFTEFQMKHGTHYENCIQNRRLGGLIDNKNNNNNKGRKQRNKSFSFNGEKFNSIEMLKGSFKGILTKTIDDEKIKEPFHSMLKEILQYHEHRDEKTQDLDYFTVNVNPEFKQTRCFYAVSKDGTKRDFSIVKCLKNFEEKLKK